jgi:hypothetical protein
LLKSTPGSEKRIAPGVRYQQSSSLGAQKTKTRLFCEKFHARTFNLQLLPKKIITKTVAYAGLLKWQQWLSLYHYPHTLRFVLMCAELSSAARRAAKKQIRKMMCRKVKPAVRRPNLFCSEYPLSARINTSIIITTHEKMMVQAESDITAAAAAVRALNRLTPPCKFAIQIYIFGGKNKAGSTFCGQTSCRGLRPQSSHCGIAQRAFLPGHKLNHQVPYCV